MYFLVVPYINPADYAPGVQIGHALVGHYLPKTNNAENLKSEVLASRQNFNY